MLLIYVIAYHIVSWNLLFVPILVGLVSYCYFNKISLRKPLLIYFAIISIIGFVDGFIQLSSIRVGENGWEWNQSLLETIFERLEEIVS